eukprot:868640-Prorocentrum_minimum.AAC.2
MAPHLAAGEERREGDVAGGGVQLSVQLSADAAAVARVLMLRAHLARQSLADVTRAQAGQSSSRAVDQSSSRAVEPFDGRRVDGLGAASRVRVCISANPNP